MIRFRGGKTRRWDVTPERSSLLQGKVLVSRGHRVVVYRFPLSTVRGVTGGEKQGAPFPRGLRKKS